MRGTSPGGLCWEKRFTQVQSCGLIQQIARRLIKCSDRFAEGSGPGRIIAPARCFEIQDIGNLWLMRQVASVTTDCLTSDIGRLIRRKKRSEERRVGKECVSTCRTQG